MRTRVDETAAFDVKEFNEDMCQDYSMELDLIGVKTRA